MNYRLAASVFSASASMGLVASATAQTLEPGIANYHVAIDNAQNIGFGTYVGLPNPNYQRLTLVLSHVFPDNPLVNHFHRIGSYGYAGPAGSPTPAFSTNNRLPEPYQADDGLILLPGSGAFAGKLISGLGFDHFPQDSDQDHVEEEYSDLLLKPIDALFVFDGVDDGDPLSPEMHPGHHLLNASRGAYRSSVSGVTVGLKLLDLTPGLTIHDQTGNVLFNAINEVVTLGSGSNWEFDPVFAVEGSAIPGSMHSASFGLVDLTTGSSSVYGDSAPFSIDFVAVPEPAAAVMLLGLGAAALRRRA